MPPRKSVTICASTVARLPTAKSGGRKTCVGTKFESDTAVLQGRVDSQELHAKESGTRKWRKRATAVAKLTCLSAPISDNGVTAAARRNVFSKARTFMMQQQLASDAAGLGGKMAAAKAVLDGSRSDTRQRRCVRLLQENAAERRNQRQAEEEEDNSPIQDYSSLLDDACEYAASLHELSRSYAEMAETNTVTSTLGKIDHCMDLLKALRDSGAACIESLTQAREISESGQLSQALLANLADEIAAMREALASSRQGTSNKSGEKTLGRGSGSKLLDVLRQLGEKGDGMQTSCEGYFDKIHSKAMQQEMPEETAEDQDDLAARRLQAAWLRKRKTVGQVIACKGPPMMPEKEREEEKEDEQEGSEEEQQPEQQVPQAQEQAPLEKDDKEDDDKKEVAMSSVPMPDAAEISRSSPCSRPSTAESAPIKPSRFIFREARPPALDIQGVKNQTPEKYATTPAALQTQTMASVSLVLQPKPPDADASPAKSQSPKVRLPLLRAPPRASDDDGRICKNMDDLKPEELELLRFVIDEEAGQAPVRTSRSSVSANGLPAARTPRSAKRLGSTSPTRRTNAVIAYSGLRDKPVSPTSREPRHSCSGSSRSVTHDPAKERLWREVFELDKSLGKAVVARSAWAESEPGELSQVSTASPRSLEPFGDDSPRLTLSGLVGNAQGQSFRRRVSPQSLEPLQFAHSARRPLR
eukprot:TRINITY_DN21899_c0_g1_i1.p1 TRINITY_DN21899_c0_g1~~TRINITY_DN21899_c0_g1_i1.p1  ORF type:complete len:713 (-),score=140.48 TRINITY_DN21899_c0_g1_i1:372-2468(-)